MRCESYDFSQIVEDPKKKLILIIYDISDNKRRAKMVKHLEAFGYRVQKSAFEALLNKNMYNKLVSGIPPLINSEDNVRIYKLNSTNEVLLWGTTKTVYEEDVIVI